MRPGSKRTAQALWSAADAPESLRSEASSAAAAAAMLRLVDLPAHGTAPREILLPTKAGEEIVVGRGSKGMPVDVAVTLMNIEKEVISRRHLRVQCVRAEGGGVGYRAEDLGALNGVFVNGFKIASCDLKDGDSVQIGGMNGLAVGAPLPDVSDMGIKYKFFCNPNSSSSSAASGSNSRKRSLMGNSDSMQHLKKQSSPPISLSNGDHSSALQKQNALYQEQLIKQQLDIKTRDVENLKLQVVNLQRELHEGQDRLNGENAELIASLAKKDEAIKALKTQVDKTVAALNAAKQPPTAADGCTIDVSSLRACVMCAICTQPLLDAAIMKCSHAFCRACLEEHLATRPLRYFCPVCNDKPPKNFTTASPRPLVFVRSDNLDQLVWMLYEASSKKDKQQIKEREKKSRATLIALGIDPDSVENVGVNQVDSQQSNGTAKRKKKSSSKSKSKSKSEEEEDEDEDDDDDLPVCDDCGDKHEEGRCPHKEDIDSDDDEELESEKHDSQEHEV